MNAPYQAEAEARRDEATSMTIVKSKGQQVTAIAPCAVYAWTLARVRTDQYFALEDIVGDVDAHEQTKRYNEGRRDAEPLAARAGAH